MQSVDRATSSTKAQCKLFLCLHCRSVYSGLLARRICQDKRFGGLISDWLFSTAHDIAAPKDENDKPVM
jgi:hypothetical protein